MRGRLSEAQRRRHSNTPELVQWDTGVILPRGAELTNGTWSPRYNW